MRLAVSNIAWRADEDALAADVLLQAGITAIEVAPTVRWPAPLDATAADLRHYRAEWQGRGIEIVALQSLLFGRPDLEVFGPPATRAALVDYLGGICRVAAALGATRCVFGSPANRRPGDLDAATRDDIAVEVFAAIAARAAAEGVVVGLEANPAEYGCTWIQSVGEAAAFVERVAHPGLGLHLDAGGMLLHGDTSDVVERVLRAPGACHVHASDPRLATPGDGDPRSAAWHATLAGRLDEAGYDGVVSLEMRRLDDRDRREHLGLAAGRLTAWYGATPRTSR